MTADPVMFWCAYVSGFVTCLCFIALVATNSGGGTGGRA